jgi:SAM-dependent methyltransferase
LPTCALYGTDIDAEAIEWLQNNNAKIAEFSVNPNIPPTSFEDNKFDFIYSISIFTHLPEKMQFAWLEELKRISKPGGYLLVTVHGENHHKNLPAPKREIMEAKGFYYNDDADLTEGLPSFYKNAYHSANYIKKEWGVYFDVIKIIPMGLDNHQDIVLLRKQA